MSPTTTTCVLCAEENHHPLYNFPQMYQAYLGCREDKRNTPSALKFELDHEANLMALVQELRERRYRPTTSICFYTLKPKCREVFAADFRDRVVHHLVYNALLPDWERVFIHHLKHAQSRRCVKKLWQKFPFIQRFFRVFSHKLARLDQRLRRTRRLKPQVHWLQYRFKGYLCLIEIGCYFEAFNADAQKLAPRLGLRLQKNWRGFAYGCGFPRRFLMKNLARLKQAQVPVVVIRETGRELYRTKERLPYLLLEYPKPV